MKYFIVALIILILISFHYQEMKYQKNSINRQWIEELSKRNLIIKTEHSFNWKASSQD